MIARQPNQGLIRACTPAVERHYHSQDPAEQRSVYSRGIAPREEQGRLVSSGFNYAPEDPAQRVYVVSPRFKTPDLLGDGCDDPVAYLCDKGRPTPPWISDAADVEADRVANDYDDVGSIGQVRATLETLYALAQFSQARTDFVITANDAAAAFPQATTPVSIGFRLDWNVNLLNSSAFDLEISTVGFLPPAVGRVVDAFPANSMNREFTVRIAQGVAGGSIFVPWATRPTGMGNAKVGLAVPDDAANINIIGIPTAFTANNAFSAQVTLLTAHHPNTAIYARALGAYNPTRKANSKMF